MKVLVTGAAGFIGFHLVNRLLVEGWQVVGLDNLNDYYDPTLKRDRLIEQGVTIDANSSGGVDSTVQPNYRFYRLDLEHLEGLEALFAKERIDIVCNLAAQAGVRYSLENPLAYIRSNVLGFGHILECCRNFKVQHLVYASSSSVYGLNKEIPFRTTDAVDNPASLYAATKKSNELMAHTYSHLYQLPTTGLRFFTVYGPWGRPDMAYYLFTKAILSDKPIKVFNHGRMQRDFTYIDDIVEGIFRILSKPPQVEVGAPYKVYNIGAGKPSGLIDFIHTIEAELGQEAEKIYKEMQPGDVEVTYADTTDLEQDFGYRPSTSLAIGIKTFVKWYKAYYQL